MQRNTGTLNFPLLGAVLILIFLGIAAIASSSSVLSWNRFGNTHYYLVHQIIFGVIPGLIILALASRIHYQIWRKLATVLILLVLAILVLVLLPGVGLEIGGSRRWLSLGFAVFQPSELAKLALIIYLAAWFDKKQRGLHDFVTGFLPSLVIVILVAGLIFLQPDMGTLIVICITAAAMFFTAGTKLRHLLVTGGLALSALFLAILSAPYRTARLITFLDPNHDPQGIGYHVNQALLAVGSGGLWGLGYNHSLQKYNYLPEPIGDSIFAVMAEELGFIRVSLLIICFLIFGWLGFKISTAAPDNFARMLAAGITTWIVAQAFINIASMLALTPLTGITLPLISYGSSSLVATLAGVGVLLNVSRYVQTR